MKNPATELTRALTENEELVAKKRKPTRFDVRALFIPLGALILEGDLVGLAPTIEHLATFIGPDDEDWQRAVAEELGLAGEEYSLSVDPKYLALPNYDFDYTERSRETLECRLRAAEHLGFGLPRGLEGRIAKADALLEPYLDARSDG
jgi:hypothetical protein